MGLQIQGNRRMLLSFLFTSAHFQELPDVREKESNLSSIRGNPSWIQRERISSRAAPSNSGNPSSAIMSSVLCWDSSEVTGPSRFLDRVFDISKPSPETGDQGQQTKDPSARNLSLLPCLVTAGAGTRCLSLLSSSPSLFLTLEIEEKTSASGQRLRILS